MANKTTTINYKGNVYTLEKFEEQQRVLVTDGFNASWYVEYFLKTWSYPTKNGIYWIDNLQEAVYKTCEFLLEGQNSISVFNEQVKAIGL